MSVARSESQFGCFSNQSSRTFDGSSNDAVAKAKEWLSPQGFAVYWEKPKLEWEDELDADLLDPDEEWGELIVEHEVGKEDLE